MTSIVEQQPDISQLFLRMVKNNQLGHAYLFEGPAGTGKKDMALWVSAVLFCERPHADGMPCGSCVNCTRIREHNHPDVVEVEPDGQSIKVDQVRLLKAEFSKSGVESSRKVFVIEHAEKMTQGAANSLLKFLEEPDGDVTAFLLTTAKQRLLPTILSRCQDIHFKPLPKQKWMKELEEEGVSASKAALLAYLTQDLEKAKELNEDEWFESAVDTFLRWQAMVEKKDPQAFIFIQTDVMPTFKERNQQELVLDLFMTYYRDLLKVYYQSEETLAFPTKKRELQRAAQETSAKEIAQQLSIFLEARKMLDRYVAAQGVFEHAVLQMI